MKHFFAITLFLFSIAFAAPPPGFVPSGTQWFPSISIQYSDPLKLTGAVGVSLLKLQPFGQYSGFFGRIEAGAGGGRIGAGYRIGKHQFMPLYTLGLAGSLMHTWGNPLGEVECGQTYMGVELSGNFLPITVSAGVYKHIAGDSENDDLLWTAGAGLGI